MEQVNDIAQAFEVEVDGARDAIELIEKANQALSRLVNLTLISEPSESLPSFDTLPELNRAPDAVRGTMEAVAHEIRNPVTAIGGFARRLAKTIDPTSHEAAYVRLIMAETDRLEHVFHTMRQMLV